MCKCPGDKVKKWPLTFDTHLPSINSLRCLLLPTFMSLATIVLWKFHCFSAFSYRKALCYQIWPCRKNWSRSTPGSSFEQTMMGWSPRCYIPNFMKICPTGSGEEDFWRVFTIYLHLPVTALQWTLIEQLSLFADKANCPPLSTLSSDVANTQTSWLVDVMFDLTSCHGDGLLNVMGEQADYYIVMTLISLNLHRIFAKNTGKTI